MTTMQIRPGEADDVPVLLAIYNHYVESSHVTFDTEAQTLEERTAWFAQYRPSGPHRLLVASLGGEVAGYAASSPFHHKPIYASSVETSVYISQRHWRCGVGTRLYRDLIASLEAEASVHRLYAGITLPNAASMALHRSLGFVVAGTFKEVSQKQGRFWDLCWLERAV